MVRAPIPLVNLSAVLSQEEIYEHCTVYHYDPTCQSRRNTEHLTAATAIGQHQHHLDNALLSEHNNYQPTALDVQVTDQQHIDFDIEAGGFSQGDAALLGSPPAYSSITAQGASPVGKDGGMMRTSAHGSNIISFPSENATIEFPHRENSLIVSGSFNSNSHEALRHSEPDNVHGLGLFPPQESFNAGIHGESFTVNDSFTTVKLSPPILSQLDEQAFDEDFCQRHDANYEYGGAHMRSNRDDVGDDAILAKKER
ncbi:hypothetical protein CORC01_01347 [Colletotrichum orchidophilum]|uniref:Uncharacterized protein n=1 Tax=Colletotrichum orchidophilum TaxID=1209926 RepID=A0A1G4BPE5_9PEZI|nr:uncharacterized protein CORC01_01347 [Colletotrichum orchidophilum]OHF03294.1 hypothetical protein CORC01_01347 [Colletotrichum orchidophilum]